MSSAPWLWLLAGAAVVGIAYWVYSSNIKSAELRQENLRLEQEALDAVQMKKEFVSRVSHELKAPLASMQETTHLLLEQIPGPLTDKQRRLLELNLQSGKRLAGMIGNILDLSKLEAGIASYDMRELDIRDLLHNVLLAYHAESRDKSLHIAVRMDPEPIVVRGDASRLSQLLSNLMENAINFSPKYGTVSVRATTIEAGPALISFTDSGPGVAEAEKQEIFEVFHPMSTRRNKSRGQGFGLGLPIARTIAEAHGGIIWLVDNPQGGSIFSVLLPGPKGSLVTDRLDDLHLHIA